MSCTWAGVGGSRSGELFGQDHFPFLGWWYPSSKAAIHRPPHCSAMLGQWQFLWSNVLSRQITSTVYTVHSGTKILFPVLHTAACSNEGWKGWMKVTLEEENLKGSTVRSEEEITANAIWRGFKECQDRDYLWWTDWGRHFVERKRWWEHWLNFSEVGCLPLLSAFSARWCLYTVLSTL